MEYVILAGGVLLALSYAAAMVMWGYWGERQRGRSRKNCCPQCGAPRPKE